MLPLVPFAKAPKKSWKRNQEKKGRMTVEIPEEISPTNEADVESDYSSISDSESDGDSVDTDDSFEIRQRHIRKLLPPTPLDGEAPPPYKFVDDDDLDVAKPKKGCIRWMWRKFLEWRKKEREKRMHPIFKEYENAVRAYDEKLKQQLLDDLEAHRKAVILEAYRTNQRIMRQSKEKVNKQQLVVDFTKDLVKRDNEARKMEYYCVHLQQWAGERDVEYAQQQLDKELALEEKRVKLLNDKKLQERNDRKAADARVLQQDHQMTVQTLVIMRQSGMLPGVNADQKKLTEKPLLPSHVVELTLREGFDYAKRKGRGAHNYDEATGTPFNADILSNRGLTQLSAKLIGERGALCLASEFTRGACSLLESLCLQGCEIKSRGLGRLMFGIKQGNLTCLTYLNLRGNLLEARGLEYIRNTFESGVLDNLKVLDLRDNEIGDSGADIIMRMIVSGALKNMSHILLQRNGITDIGFGKLIRIVQSMSSNKCGQLVRLGLEGNFVSPEAKKLYKPLPTCVSV